MPVAVRPGNAMSSPLRQFAQLRQRYGTGRVLRYAVEALLTHLVYIFFRLLPLDVASAIGGRLLETIGPRFSRSRRTVLPQLALAFPEKSPAEHVAIMHGMWNNLGRIFAEYAHLGHLYDRVTVEGAEHLEAARLSGRPLIFVTGHIGNWELSSVTVQNAGIPLHVVYRAPNNPWVTQLLRRARRAGAGERLIAKGADGARQILGAMRRKEAIGLLVDQRMTGAEEIPFFGKPAQTGAGVAVFAQKYDAQVHYIRVERTGGAYFKVTVSPPVAVPADQRGFLQDINNELERWVRDRPEQWLWTHKRWKISQ